MFLTGSKITDDSLANSQFYLEEKAYRIDVLRRNLILQRNGRPIFFIYCYGTESTRKASQVLTKSSIKFIITPTFSNMESFIEFLNDMILH